MAQLALQVQMVQQVQQALLELMALMEPLEPMVTQSSVEMGLLDSFKVSMVISTSAQLTT